VVTAMKGSQAVVNWHGQTWAARILRVEEAVDLALLEVPDDAPMPGLELSKGERPLAPGEPVYVLGCPFGTEPSVTAGIISALPGAILKPEALRSRIQLNAAINPGNSGGPVLDLEGKVIGVASAAIMGGYGLGFAVPVGDLVRLLNAERESHQTPG